jgi:hypothetical protein
VQRLNIPLHRYQQATRLPRRVVSTLAVLAVAGALGVGVAGTCWFERDTTSAAAPQETALVLHFQPNRVTWKAVERALGSTTLISNRPLTVSDIRPFVRGEFSLFVDKGGIRSIAVRAKRDEVPIDLLDSLGILATETSRGVFLLSDRPVARMNWSPSRIWFGWIRWPTRWHIGEAYLVDEPNMRGPIFASAKSTVIRLPKQEIFPLPWNRLPSGTIFALATPVLPNTSIAGITDSIDTILASYDTPTAGQLTAQLAERAGFLLLSGGERSTSFVFGTEADDFAKNLQQKIIQTAAALQTPRLRPFALPDQSVGQEMIVDPSLTTIEETTVSGSLVARAAAGQGVYLYTTESNGQFFVSNDQNLLTFGVAGNARDSVRTPCGGNALFLGLRDLLDASSGALTSRPTDATSMIANVYSDISVSQGWLFTNLHLCY